MKHLLTWSNLLSLSRLPLAGAFAAAESAGARLLIAGAAGASDWIDGRLARWTGRTTRVGELLDPLTDKVFVLTASLTLLLEGLLEPWMLAALLLRDIYTSVAFLVAAARKLPIRFRSRMPGKIVTTLQVVALVAALAWRPALAPVALVTLVASIWAIVDYTRAALDSLRRFEQAA